MNKNKVNIQGSFLGLKNMFDIILSINCKNKGRIVKYYPAFLVFTT